MVRLCAKVFVVIAALIGLSVQASPECVVLLHGLARTSQSMSTLEGALLEQNFTVANVDYPSRTNRIEVLAPNVIAEGIERCTAQSSERVHFVTHSMGGILVRYYLENNAIHNLGHVVMLAPPNQGSEVVDRLSDVPGFALINGPAGLQLGTDSSSIPSKLGPVEYSLGIVAGKKTFNPILSQFLPNPDDGKVSVESTKVEGMADFLLVDVSHPFIMADETVIGHVITFLKVGAFHANPP